MARLLRDWRVEYSSEAAKQVGPEVRPLWDGRMYFRLRETERDLLVHYRLERGAPTFELDMRLVAVLPLSKRVGRQRFLLALFSATSCATLGMLLALLALFRPQMRYSRPQQDTKTRDLYFRSLIMVYSAMRRARFRDRLRVLPARLGARSIRALRQLLDSARRTTQSSQNSQLPHPTSTASAPPDESLLVSLRAANRFPLLVSDQRDVTYPRECRRGSHQKAAADVSRCNLLATSFTGAQSRAAPGRLSEHMCAYAGECGRKEPRAHGAAVGHVLSREGHEVEQQTSTSVLPSATCIALHRLDSLLDHSHFQSQDTLL